MNNKISQLIDDIAYLPEDWHGEGCVGINILKAIVRYSEDFKTINQTIETGSGKTTLLFSHLSKQHLVFALDKGESISKVRNSKLFNPTNITFIEGPTQRTLPKFYFKCDSDIILIDGPHGYPFPDIEYFYLYPTLKTGGLLIIDDIMIPSINRMFEILKADAMYQLIDIIDDNTAFFKRTNAPLIDPESDSWWLQGFNEIYFKKRQNFKTEKK